MQVEVYTLGCRKAKESIPAREENAMSSHGSRILAVTAAGMLFAGVHSIRAAEFDGSVQGVVKSASGQALPGAYVKLTNPQRRLTFMVVSQAQGRYTMNNLPPGNYTVQGIGNGLRSKPTPVALTAGKPATADVALTDEQAEVPNGWIRSPGRVAGNELDHELPPPNLPEGEGKAIMEAKCVQCHFLHRPTQMRWTHDNWEQKIAWMRERIHDKPGGPGSDRSRKQRSWSIIWRRIIRTPPRRPIPMAACREPCCRAMPPGISPWISRYRIPTRHFTTSRWIRGELPG